MTRPAKGGNDARVGAEKGDDRRQAIRILKALGRMPASVREADGMVTLAMSSAGDGATREVSLSQALFRALRADERLRDLPDGAVAVSEAGRSWLRRTLAGGDFSAQHRETQAATVEDGAGGRLAVTIDLSESPLAWLASRRRPDGGAWIDRVQLAAGERLRSDYTRAGLTPRITADWSGSVHHGRKRSGASGGLADLSDAAIDARARVHRALDDVGPELGGVLVDVCCDLQGLESVERKHGWPARSAKVILALALSRLADTYGLREEARGRDRATVRHWGQEGYRPRIDGGNKE